MLSRRAFLKNVLSLAGVSALPGPRAAAIAGRITAPLLQIYENFPEEYFRSLAPSERARIFNLMAYSIRQQTAVANRALLPPAPPEDVRESRIDSPYRVCLGDPHGHSKHSDGRRSPENYYRYARRQGLDFAVLTDHAEILSPEEWALNREATQSHYRPGEFVTLSAYEYTNCVDGNYDIYMLTEQGEAVDYEEVFAWYNFFVWRLKDQSNPNMIKNPRLLFEALKRLKHTGRLEDVMAVPHHCSWLLAPTNWRYHDPEMVFFAEGYSKHGNSIFPAWFEDSFDKIPYAIEGTSIMDALGRGVRIGIAAATDTHAGMPGSIHIDHQNSPFLSYSGGLTGVLIGENEPLDRRSIWDAMKKRRIFGTRVFGLQMSFRVGEQEMGSEIRSSDPPSFYVEVFLPRNREQKGAQTKIQAIEIVKNGMVVFRERDLGNRHHAVIDSWTDPGFSPARDNCYFLRVVGYSGDLAWSSPIFADKAI